jgi:FkbM family methyltransferase
VCHVLSSGLRSFLHGTDGGRTNSLSPVSGPRTELVPVTTLDEFVLQSALETVVMAKIDAEGLDALILRGAETALTRGVIEVVQFEYNWRWLLFHQCLRDVFDLISN